ncbi:MAG TPA: lysophospholipid acyltransferase family protein [Ferruginibacter sp.]|nr:lipid A biosynthesis acyltransferase [Chitinophagaceae bacterium]HRI24122.1 lysophospholipid acyltransferase family protein [Ferruginibacter sp.]
MYYIIYGFLYLLSLLPLRLLYVLSDLVSFFLFRVFGYRRKVIEGNLGIAFPEKTVAERKAIARKFHRNFTDSFIETIKCLSVSKDFYDRHCSADFSLFDELAKENLSCQMHACHQFNWEWINLHWSVHLKQPFAVVYMPISSKPLDKLFYKIRAKYGTVLMPATDIKRSFVAWARKTHCLALVADQKPASAGSSNWLYFFNKPTPFVTGPEKNAILKKCPVVFGKAFKTGRGKYDTQVTLACRDASLLKPGELTIMYRDFIEAAIRSQPDMYLWSHKRFKYEWDESYRHLWIDPKPV